MTKRKLYRSQKTKKNTTLLTHQRSAKKRKNLSNKKLKDHSTLANLYRPFIKNYSDIVLSDIQIIALAKGLKHIPTPKKPLRSKLVEDFDLYARRMRIKYIMHTKKDKFNPFRLKSQWTPLDSENHKLEGYLEETKKSLCHLRYIRPQPNLTSDERNALNALTNDPSIVIKKPDKTRGICIMSDFQYRKVGFHHLSSNHYELIPNDQTHETAQLVYNTLIDMNMDNVINDDTFDFLNPLSKEIRTNYMYFLAKTHKPPPPNGLPFHTRPICSGTNGPTSNISTFCDYFLKPIASQQSTFVKDTTDIINKIEANSYPHDVLIATIDVTAMYCNIIQSEAIEIACEAYDKSNIIYDIKKPPTKYMKALLSLILEHNTFSFGDCFYKQKIGLAMGSPVSPSLANLSLYPLELKFLQNSKKILTYWRFLDDCLIIFSGTRTELEDHIKTLNTMHPTIKFTASISDTQIDYLDITIFKGDRFKETGILDVKIYTKPCETFMYITPTSTHPPATFSGFIKGEFLRIARNSNNEHDFIERSNLFSEKLIARGYKLDFINNIRKLVSHSDRPNLLKQSKPEPNKPYKPPLVFSTEYTGHLESRSIKTALTEHWNIIGKDPKLQHIFPTPPLIAFRRAKNLQDKLVRAKLPPDEDLNILIELANE